ncbi:hypothetical protein [Elizabethkingia bruuniana]|uniref:hypothetical protein n=1 Tax=Elizabethkingia bruuniana TaxID=1756149 RepID=UPI001055D243|nr:hypothetical protein [Elizabethkingia bruuniana]
MSIKLIIDKDQSDNCFEVEANKITLTPKQHEKVIKFLNKIDKVIFPYQGYSSMNDLSLIFAKSAQEALNECRQV